jgi:hypothetical protein
MIGTNPTKRTVSLAIIGTFLFVILAFTLGVIGLMFSGVIETNLAIGGTITIGGTIPVTLVITAILGALGVVLWTGLSGVYGEDTVDAATDDIADTAEEVTDGGGGE